MNTQMPLTPGYIYALCEENANKPCLEPYVSGIFPDTVIDSMGACSVNTHSKIVFTVLVASFPSCLLFTEMFVFPLSFIFCYFAVLSFIKNTIMGL